MPAKLHERLREDALNSGRSLNEFCVQRLSAPSTLHDDAAAIVLDAMEVFGQHLIGMIEFGSGARGEATAASDIDVLIVLDRSLPITRDLYRRWDTRERHARGRRVDAHLTHVPNLPTEGGVWAEAAIDGRVWFERDDQLSGALTAIRADIASGRLQRQSVHGQTYWTAA